MFKNTIFLLLNHDAFALVSIPKQTKFITYVNLNVCVLCDLPPGRLSDSDANSDQSGQDSRRPRGRHSSPNNGFSFFPLI